LLRQGDAALHKTVQDHWPLDAQAAFGALPTPLRLHADPRYTGRGITIAMVDAAFYPHDDLVDPVNRIRAWVDASRAPVEVRRFTPDEKPRWPGWDAGASYQWHGLMTSVVTAGDGGEAYGLYRGIACDADLVLVQVRGEGGRIGNAAIARALHWLLVYGPEFGVKVVNLSLGGDAVTPLAGNPVDEAVTALVVRGVTVVVAAGNDGERRLVPPGTAPFALTIGGIDDKNSFDRSEIDLWHSNYGETAAGALKPELVAPSIWVVAPVLPGTDVAAEAQRLFERRAEGDPEVEKRIAEQKLVTPHYQHVEGTSFAAPIVSSVVACMLEANPDLTPRRVRELLVAAAYPVPGAPVERQGAGALDAGRAVTLALADEHGDIADFVASPLVHDDGSVRILLHDHAAREVRVVGSWDGWTEPGRTAIPVEDGLWQVDLKPLARGRYLYKFRIDGARWFTDPANPSRTYDGYHGWNSSFTI
jgi:serine protease AprX